LNKYTNQSPKLFFWFFRSIIYSYSSKTLITAFKSLILLYH